VEERERERLSITLPQRGNQWSVFLLARQLRPNQEERRSPMFQENGRSHVAGAALGVHHHTALNS